MREQGGETMTVWIQKFLIFLLIVFCGFEGLGQSNIRYGVVRDGATNQILPYATVRIQGESTGTLTNEFGEFELRLPPNISPRTQIIISSIGYQNKEIALSDWKGKEELNIELIAQDFTLNEVFIYAVDYTAKEMLKAALKRVKKNFPTKPFLQKSFYRHYCIEKGEYGRLIEAAVDIYDPKGYRSRYGKPSNKVALKVRQLRRSFDFTSFSTLRHRPIALDITLQADFAGYESWLSKNIGKRGMTCTFADTTFFNGKMVFVIQAKYKGRYSSKVFIVAENLAILRVEDRVEIYVNNEFQRGKQVTRHSIQYKKIGEKYFPEHFVNHGEQRIHFLDSLGNTINTRDHTHHIEMLVNETQQSGFIPFKGKEPSAEQLYKIPYQADFWENYNILKATPLEMGISEDLAKRLPLDKQYTSYNQRDPELEDIMEEIAFDRIISENKGKYVLIYFWESGSLPRIKDLLLARKITKEYRGMPVSFVFLSTDTDVEAWRKAVAVRGMYVGNNFRLAKGTQGRLAKRFSVSQAPHYVILDKEGKVVYNKDNLPGRTQLKELLAQVMKE